MPFCPLRGDAKRAGRAPAPIGGAAPNLERCLARPLAELRSLRNFAPRQDDNARRLRRSFALPVSIQQC